MLRSFARSRAENCLRAAASTPTGAWQFSVRDCRPVALVSRRGCASATATTSGTASSNPLASLSNYGAAPDGSLAVTYTPGSGPGGPLAAPTTALTEKCNILSECVTKADELKMQMKAQEAAGSAAQILSADAMEEFALELKESAREEFGSMVATMRESPALMQSAGMHELRRTLFYAVQMKERDWVEPAQYQTAMRGLTVELLRRDNDGVLSPDDTLFVSTQFIVANFYNRHLWNRMEKAMQKASNFDNLDLATIKGLSTRLFKSRPGCARETMDVRRKVLNAMARRVGVLANDFDLPSLIGILQCYTVHDQMPRMLEPLAHRAVNHISDFTPQECASLATILRKWKLMRLEVCEKVVERIATADNLTHSMALGALLSIRACFSRVSDGGRNALNAEPMRQKLRAMGEQICSRLDEVEFPVIAVVLQTLDCIVTMKIYVPKKCLQHVFVQANDLLAVMTDTEDGVDPKTGKKARPVTNEEARQLQALLYHYGSDLSHQLATRLKDAFRDGVFPDEASMH